MAPRELRERLDSGEAPLLLDVREGWEFDISRIEGSRHIPMGEISGRVSELEPEAEVVVICHHGARSAHVADALSRFGFERVFNLAGGLDAYSDVDPGVRKY
ncbi:MAG: rhodanese-like domain-containing protein [Actinomycetota bacterium]|jgi:rhodanese-related sulfurtransferase|nr:sulfurtransferase [Rubrobacter sp.]MDQ3508439.1 rhodanese-like domain-containing protein [Actinomycetota bacterium]